MSKSQKIIKSLKLIALLSLLEIAIFFIIELNVGSIASYFMIGAIYVGVVVLLFRSNLIIKKLIPWRFVCLGIFVGVLLLLFQLLVSRITNLHGETALNDSQTTFNLFLPTAVIIAPIIEEHIFRLYLPAVFNNKILGFVASSVLFALFHSNHDLTSSSVYMVMALAFSYLYIKSNNIWTSIIAHSLLNIMIVIWNVLV